MPTAPVRTAAIGLPNRRDLLAGAAAVLATPAAAAVASSALDELIADHGWTSVAFDQAWEHCHALERGTVLPEVKVLHGRRRHENMETREVEWRPWVFKSEADVNWYFDAVWTHNPASRDEVERRRQAVLAALDQSRAEHRAAEDAAGITAARSAKAAARGQMRSIELAIFSYIPSTMDEVRAKNAYLLHLLLHGHDFDDDLEMIFGAVNAIASN